MVIVDSSNSTQGFATNILSFPVTVLPTVNRYLIVTVCPRTSVLASGVTYGGVPLALITSNLSVQFWGLLNPAIGLANVVINYAANQAILLGAGAALSGVDQVTPVGVIDVTNPVPVSVALPSPKSSVKATSGTGAGNLVFANWRLLNGSNQLIDFNEQAGEALVEKQNSSQTGLLLASKPSGGNIQSGVDIQFAVSGVTIAARSIEMISAPTGDSGGGAIAQQDEMLLF